MQIIPAVDLLGDHATRLEQGDYGRELFREPATDMMARAAATRPPLIHLVDLQGARDGQVRTDTLRICLDAAGSVPVQVSGGIRTVDAAESVLALGASRVLISTAAFRSPTALADFVRACGDQLAVTIDVRDATVRVAGWRERTTLSVNDAAVHCVDSGVVRVMGTSIDRDGTLNGPNLDLYRELCRFPFHVLAAGGVRDQRDADELELIGCEGVVAGRAFADGVWSRV
jgi:phosphoribosylformimino-5-aminoimidazole carboxamide ribotide isomerase